MRFLPFVLLLLFPAVACGEDPKPKKPEYVTKDKHDPDGIGKFYLDREIAQVMGHRAAGWLERPEREKEEAPTKLLKALDIKEGQLIGLRQGGQLAALAAHADIRNPRRTGPSGWRPFFGVWGLIGLPIEFDPAPALEDAN